MSSAETVYHWCMMMGFGSEIAEQGKKNMLAKESDLDKMLRRIGMKFD